MMYAPQEAPVVVAGWDQVRPPAFPWQAFDAVIALSIPSMQTKSDTWQGLSAYQLALELHQCSSVSNAIGGPSELDAYPGPL